MVDYQKIFEKTRTKVFQDIYNYSSITLRNNIRLTEISGGSRVRRILQGNVTTTDLPDRYRWWTLFMVNNQHLSNLLRVYSGWVDLETILNQHQVNVDIITTGQRLVPNRLVYCKTDNCGHTLFAVLADVYDRYGETDKTTHMVIHKDTDVENQRWLVSHIPGEHDNFSATVSEAKSHDKKHLLLFIDGYEYRYEDFLIQYRTDAYLEVYVDYNVDLDFTLPLDDRPTYYSEHEELYKDLVVIPRELTNGKVYTYDTFVVSVRDESGRGVYLPFLAGRSVSSLTHTAVGISSFLIDAALDKLGTAKGSLYVQAASYSKANELVPNGNLTEEMYQLDDDFVSQVIRGETYPHVPYWTGNRLERSTYSNHLTDISDLRTYEIGKFKQLIESLGYYPFMLSICRHNGEFTDLGSSVSALTIPVPMFWESEELYPILYLDGRKIRPDRYLVDRVGEQVEITFGTPLPTNNSSSVIQYQLAKDMRQRTRQLTPNTSQPSYSIPRSAGEIKIYHKVTNVTIKAVDAVLTEGYKELPAYDNEWYTIQLDGDNYVLQFKTESFGHTFLVTFADQITYNVRHNVELSTGDTLVLQPMTQDLTTGNDVPVLTDSDFEVYINSRYLTPDIDWCIKRLVDQDDPNITSGYQIVIQNLSYLNDDSSDRFDVYQTGQAVHRRDVGYVVDRTIPRNQTNEAWIPGLSRLFINGRLVPYNHIIRHHTHYEISADYAKNGNVYCFEFGIDQTFQEAFAPYLDQEYLDGRVQVNQYFTHGYVQEYQEPVIIPAVHRIYSSYLNEIIKRILNGTIEVHFTNNDEDTLQQLAAYEYLKEFDLFYREDGKYDLRFSDIYPGYLADLKVNDLNHYKYIRRLIRIHLGVDEIHDGLVVYTGQ